MRCEHHPGAPATATCEICETPLCGVCSNYTATAVLCDRCVNSVAMSDLFASRAGKAVASAAAASSPQPRSRTSAMAKLIEEGKSLETETETTTTTKRRKPRSRIWDVMHGVGIFACFIFIGIQMYRNFGAGSVLTPSEIAAEERQRDQVQRCVMVFWEIAEVLKQGQTPGDSLRCTDPGTPNIIARVDNDIIVRHPNPQLLGYTDIFVSKNNPIPVLQP